MIDFFHPPLKGASVTLDGLSGITDENGTVTFEVPARSYTVSVSAQNFLPDSQSISVRLGEEVDVYLVLNRDVVQEEKVLVRKSGRLFSSQPGHPVEHGSIVAGAAEGLVFTWKIKAIGTAAYFGLNFIFNLFTGLFG